MTGENDNYVAVIVNIYRDWFAIRTQILLEIESPYKGHGVDNLLAATYLRIKIEFDSGKYAHHGIVCYVHAWAYTLRFDPSVNDLSTVLPQ